MRGLVMVWRLQDVVSSRVRGERARTFVICLRAAGCCPKLATRCCTSAQESESLATDLGAVGPVSSASPACTCSTLPLARLRFPPSSHVKIQLDDKTG